MLLASLLLPEFLLILTFLAVAGVPAVAGVSGRFPAVAGSDFPTHSLFAGTNGTYLFVLRRTGYQTILIGMY
jgi:hypothetical protein